MAPMFRQRFLSDPPGATENDGDAAVAAFAVAVLIWLIVVLCHGYLMVDVDS